MLNSVVREVYDRLSAALVPIPVKGGIAEKVPIPCVIVGIGTATLGEAVEVSVTMTILAQDIMALADITDRVKAALETPPYTGRVRGARRVAVRGISPIEATAAGAVAEVEAALLVV